MTTFFANIYDKLMILENDKFMKIKQKYCLVLVKKFL